MTNAECNHPECTDGSQLGQYCRAHAPMHPYAMIDLIDNLATDLGHARMEIHNLKHQYVPVRIDGENYWSCMIGPATPEELTADGLDAPMRRAVEEAFFGITGRCDSHCSSGWGSSPDAMAREAIQEVDNRCKNSS